VIVWNKGGGGGGLKGKGSLITFFLGKRRAYLRGGGGRLKED